MDLVFGTFRVSFVFVNHFYLLFDSFNFVTYYEIQPYNFLNLASKNETDFLQYLPPSIPKNSIHFLWM